jgi:hypothetical protein
MDKQTCDDFLKILEHCSTVDNPTCTKFLEGYIKQCVNKTKVNYIKTSNDIDLKDSSSKP